MSPLTHPEAFTPSKNQELAMASQSVIELTDSNFQTEVLESDKPVLVDFWAEWCGPCRALAPTIEQIATEFQGKVKVGKINTDDNQNVPIQYSIQAIPTVILFHKGQVVQKFVGLRGKKEFVAELQKVSA
jgi:thioredoxin 1